MVLINHTKEIIDKLKVEGKSITLNSPKDIENIRAINKHMEEVRRDFLVKQFESELSASRIFLC